MKDEGEIFGVGGEGEVGGVAVFAKKKQTKI